jgi:hypothetical protein
MGSGPRPFLLRPLPQNEYEFLGPAIRRVRDLPNWSKPMIQGFILVLMD